MTTCFRSPPSLSPKMFHRVVVESCVSADDRNLFDYRLINDEPVEWVTMMKRQCRKRCRMTGLDGQNQKTVLNNAPIKSPSTNQRKVCVSRSIFMTCTRQNLSGAHRLRPEFPGSLCRNQTVAAPPQAKVAARRRTVNPSPHLSRFTHNVKDCKPSATGLDVTSRFLLTSSGSLILEPSFGWPARVAFLNPLFSTPRSIFHLSASLDMLPKGV